MGCDEYTKQNGVGRKLFGRTGGTATLGWKVIRYYREIRFSGPASSHKIEAIAIAKPNYG